MNSETCERDFEDKINILKTGDSTYRILCLVYAFWMFDSGKLTDSLFYSNEFIKLIDTVLIIYGPNDILVNIIEQSRTTGIITLNKMPVPDSFPSFTSHLITLDESGEVNKMSDPSIYLFEKSMNAPILLENMISNWPALTKWETPSFWVSIAGHRFFPVEIGNHYLNDNWTQKIMKLNDYLENYVFSDSKKIAYIAQHNWIHQIPELLCDFETPDLCDIFLNPKMSSVLIHLWFGMKNTFTQ